MEAEGATDVGGTCVTEWFAVVAEVELEVARERVFRAGEPGVGTPDAVVTTGVGVAVTTAAAVVAAAAGGGASAAAGAASAGADMPAAKAQTFSHTAWPAVGRQMSGTACWQVYQD